MLYVNVCARVYVELYLSVKISGGVTVISIYVVLYIYVFEHFSNIKKKVNKTQILKYIYIIILARKNSQEMLLSYINVR